MEAPTPRYHIQNVTAEEHRKNILKSRNELHTRTLSAKEVNNQRKMTNQKRGSRALANHKMYTIRKSQSADQLERSGSPISPIKDHENVAFDSKLKIKRMLSKEEIDKVSMIDT